MESLCKINTQKPPLHPSFPNRCISKTLFPSFVFAKTPLSKTSSSSNARKTSSSLRTSSNARPLSSSYSSLTPKTTQNPYPFPFSFPRPQNQSPRASYKPSFSTTPQNPFNSSNSQSPSSPQSPLHSFSSVFSLLKSISLSVSLAAAIFLLAHFPSRPAFAAAPAPPASVESILSETDDDSVSEVERERTLEEFLDSHPDDVRALQALMETKIKLRKLPEAIDAIDRLILLQPDEKEWPLLRAHLHLYGGDTETARSAFEDLIAADPLRVEAYHGLTMAVVQSETADLDILMKRIEGVMDRCKKEKKKEEFRDFRLLVAQVRVIEGKYEDALKVYHELVKEEPRDFRPYLCQGIIYTLIGKKDEAEKQFVKYRRLVPNGHPYAKYFDENVLATKVFSQMAEKDKAGSRG